MYSRQLQPPARQSFFLFGPRATGKTAWTHATFPRALFIDLLDDQTFLQLHARPGTLRDLIPPADTPTGSWSTRCSAFQRS